MHSVKSTQALNWGMNKAQISGTASLSGKVSQNESYHVSKPDLKHNVGCPAANFGLGH